MKRIIALSAPTRCRSPNRMLFRIGRSSLIKRLCIACHLSKYSSDFSSLVVATEKNTFVPSRPQGVMPATYHLNRPSIRSEEHTSELQSLMRISYAVFCLKKKNTIKHHTPYKST